MRLIFKVCTSGKQRRKLFLVFLAALCLPPFSATALVSEKVSVEEVFLAQQHHLSRMRSASMQYKETQTTYDTSPSGRRVVKKLENTISYDFEGSKIYSDNEVKKVIDETSSAGHTLISRIVAFDLEKFQMLDKSDFRLAVKNESPEAGYGINIPTLRPYQAFLDGSGKDRTLDSLRDSDRWDAYAKQAEILGRVDIDGRETVAVETKVPGSGDKFITYFAVDLGYYPLKNELYLSDGTKVMEYTVETYEEIKAAGGAIFVPLDARYRRMDPDGVVTYEIDWAVEGDSLTINEDIDDARFKIPLSLARSYEDMDDGRNSFYPDQMLKRVEREAMQLIIDGENDGGVEMQAGEVLEVGNSDEVDTLAAMKKNSSLGDMGRGERYWLVAFLVSTTAGLLVVALIWKARHSKDRRS